MDRRTKVIPQPVSRQKDDGEKTVIIETVCHRMINADPAYYPQAEFHGRTIYFCTETCLSVFLSDPERFHAAHSRRRGDPTNCEFNMEKQK